MVDEELEEPEPVLPYDPTIPMRRLAVAILLQGVTDFCQSQDLGVWLDAKRFLFSEDPDKQEHFRWTVEVSGVDRYWLRRHLVRARERTPAPSGLRSCVNCGPLPVSEFRNGNCKKCRRDQAAALRRLAGVPPRRRAQFPRRRNKSCTPAQSCLGQLAI